MIGFFSVVFLIQINWVVPEEIVSKEILLESVLLEPEILKVKQANQKHYGIFHDVYNFSFNPKGFLFWDTKSAYAPLPDYFVNPIHSNIPAIEKHLIISNWEKYMLYKDSPGYTKEKDRTFYYLLQIDNIFSSESRYIFLKDYVTYKSLHICKDYN